MSFSFNTTAGASQSTAKPKLPGNQIHTVKFDGCELQDITGVKDPTLTYKVLKLRFSNDDGYFEHTIFEPKEDDFKRRENEITNKKGSLEKIPQPSNVESMMLLFKHAIDSLNPAIAKEIDAKTKILTAPNWEELRKLVAQILDKGKNTSTSIKLLKNKAGDATFPGFFAGLTKTGDIYVKNNFIGNKLSFSAYELDRINKEAAAVPTKVTDFAPISNDVDDNETGLVLNFQIDPNM